MVNHRQFVLVEARIVSVAFLVRIFLLQIAVKLLVNRLCVKDAQVGVIAALT